MRKTEIRAIIFDLTGVIFKLNKRRLMRSVISKDLIWYLIRERKNPVDEGLTILNKMRQEAPGQFQNSVTYKGVFLPLFIVQWNQGLLTTAQALECIQSYFNELDKQHYFKSKAHKKVLLDLIQILFSSSTNIDAFKPISSTFAFVKKLRQKGDFKLYILSNIDRDTIEGLQQHYKDIFGLFDGIVTSCHSNLMKPDEAIFTFLCKEFDLKPQECCFIDDQLENVEAAHKLGMQTIHCTQPSMLPTLFKKKIDSLEK
jgi:epoxide hydrolase-like predicted phosphatase